ncbi:MAG TPA: hypothetical protein VNF05_09410 [Acidimicrobiales bacterium]|nr:hypothetical protein [Acidimicrobiales bacterium]
MNRHDHGLRLLLASDALVTREVLVRHRHGPFSHVTADLLLTRG